jgi:hypothetical protein
MPLQYWDYFLSIESDLERCSRYVDFSQNNFNTYSVEFARIIMAAAAEFDTVAKELCKQINSASTASNICQYADHILQKYPNLVTIEIVLHRYGISVKPWEYWSKTNSPMWWKAYNDIKHNRTIHFAKATLENSINAVAGLLAGILYFYYAKNAENQEEISAFDSPRLFDIVNTRFDDGFSGGGVFWGYCLP